MRELKVNEMLNFNKKLIIISGYENISYLNNLVPLDNKIMLVYDIIDYNKIKTMRKSQTLNIDDYEVDKNEFYYVIVNLREKVLFGDADENYIDYNKDNVKKLVLIMEYLKCFASTDYSETLIINETELLLTPKKQRIFARLVAELANLGLKVILITSSNYVIRELNNLIMLKTLNDEDAVLGFETIKKLNYSENELVDYNDIVSYDISENKLIELEVTDCGFEVSLIDKETEELNESSNTIFFSLKQNQ